MKEYSAGVNLGVEESEIYRANLMASIYLINAQHEFVCECDCYCDESIVEQFNIALANCQEVQICG